MTFFVVDDTDGRIVATCEDIDEALAAAAHQEEESGAPVSLVTFNDAGGSVVQTDTSVTVRTFDGWQSVLPPYE